MATVESTLRLQDQMSATLRRINAVLDQTDNGMERTAKGAGFMGTAFAVAGGQIITAIASRMGGAINSLVDYGDRMIGLTARLNLINDGMATTADVQKDIYAAAQRSRGSVEAMGASVAKLGMLAGDAFTGGTKEIVQFSELMQKSFKLSNAGAQEASSGMYQLTQAMAAGKLQGDEFRAIIENAPMLAQAIADYVGVSNGEMKKLSSEGKITADIIKNALFSAADDINTKFAQIPLTVSDAMTQVKNFATMAFASVAAQLNTGFAQAITNTMQWVIDNFQLVGSTLLWVGAIGVAVALALAAAWLFTNPIMLGIIGVIAFIGTAMAETGMSIRESAGKIGQIFGTVAAFIMNAFAAVYNYVVSVAEFFANVFDDPVANISNAFANLGMDVAQFFVGAGIAVGGAVDSMTSALVNSGVVSREEMQAIGDGIGVVVGFIGALFGMLGTVIYTIVATMQNSFADFANFFSGMLIDPAATVVDTVVGMGVKVLEVIRKVASAIDSVFGSSLAGTVDTWIGGLNNAANEFKAKHNIGNAPALVDKWDLKGAEDVWAAAQSGFDTGKKIGEGIGNSNLESTMKGFGNQLEDFRKENIPENKIKYDRMGYQDTMKMAADWSLNAFQAGTEIEKALSDMSKIGLDGSGLGGGGMGGGMGDLGTLQNPMTVNAGGGGKAMPVKGEVEITDEDIKMLNDIATRDYQLNYRQITPKLVAQFGDVRETVDVRRVIDVLADGLTQMIDSSTGVPAYE